MWSGKRVLWFEGNSMNKDQRVGKGRARLGIGTRRKASVAAWAGGPQCLDRHFLCTI